MHVDVEGLLRRNPPLPNFAIDFSADWHRRGDQIAASDSYRWPRRRMSAAAIRFLAGAARGRSSSPRG
jgi:hypothetical protein